MIIPLKHLQALDVISVLLFSLLANFILPLRIDFSTSFNFVELTKLLLLSSSSVLFYTAVDRLKVIASYSRAEYEAETSIAEKARRSVDIRYSDYCKEQKYRLMPVLVLAIGCGAMFFLVDPIIQVLR